MDTASTWTWREHETQAGDVRLVWREAARSSGEPERTLLALHGMSSHSNSWQPVVERLTAVNRVICLDFRGHGKSDWTRDGYWLSNYADDVQVLCRELDLDEFDLIGHSLGARVAMVLGNRIASAVRSVTLSDTGPEVSRAGAKKAQAMSVSAPADGRTDGFRDRAALMEYLNHQWSGFEQEALDIRADHLYRVNWVGRLVHRGDPEVTWLLGRDGLREVDDMWSGLRSYRCPALIIKARDSFLLDDELAGRMTDAMSAARLVELEGDHFVLYKQIDAFSAVVDDFLASSGGVS